LGRRRARAESVTVKAIDLDNKPVRLKLRGFTARVVQHEIDHLDGILYLDRVEDKSTVQRVPEEEIAEAESGLDGETAIGRRRRACRRRTGASDRLGVSPSRHACRPPS
jgi:hypothetical protein